MQSRLHKGGHDHCVRRLQTSRFSGSDSNFAFELPETLHMQSSAKKVRVADAFLSTDRGRNLYWIDQALAYTGARLAACISSNYAAATYVEAQNSIEVASDGNRRILSDAELRDLFPNAPRYPQGGLRHQPAEHQPPAGRQLHRRSPPNLPLGVHEPLPGNAAHVLGPLCTDIICKVIIHKGVGHVTKDQTDDGHLVELRGPITLRTLNFRLTDVDGNEVNIRGTSVSFALFLDPEK